MADLDAAVGYVVAHGDVLDRARLGHLRTSTPVSDALLAQATEGHLPGAGWPAMAHSAVASVDATCFRLSELDDFGALDAPVTREALAWLAGRQRPDGSWQEDEALADSAPAWARPGDDEATLYLTARATYWLAVSAPAGYAAGAAAEHPFAEHVHWGTQFFRSSLDGEGHWPSYLATGWYGCAVLYLAGAYYESAQIQELLAERVPTLSGGDCASLAACLRRVGMSTSDWLLVRAAGRLTETQRPDGGWDSPDGPDFDIYATLAAIRALS